jgi:hypothetical protein
LIFEFDCEVCGTRVCKRRSPANTPRPPRFCGRKCMGKAQRRPVTGKRVNVRFDCEVCDTRVETYRSPSAPTPRFCSVRCTGKAQRGAHNPSWSGGRVRAVNGYVLVRVPDHPNADPRGYVLEHRLVMERVLGRHLRPGEVVHHKNHRRDDNRPENLELFESHSAHLKAHHGGSR